MPEISIITPCYNSALFIQYTIESVTTQTFTDWEWIVTDDCSTDNSVEILQSIQDTRIKILKAEKNGGAGAARNISLKAATGRYITFLDADDFWEPNFLEEMLLFMKNQHIELAYSNYARCNEHLQPILDDFNADTEVNFDSILKTCRLSLLSSMYDTKRVGIEFFPEGTKREDHIMWLNLLKKISIGKPLNKTLAKYRMHEDSISRKKQSIVKDQYLVYKDYMQFSTAKSLYYTVNWAVNGFFKYSKIFN